MTLWTTLTGGRLMRARAVFGYDKKKAQTKISRLYYYATIKTMTRCHFVAKWRSLGNNGGKLITFLRNMGLSGTTHARTYVHSSLLTFCGQCMAFAALVIFLCP